MGGAFDAKQRAQQSARYLGAARQSPRGNVRKGLAESLDRSISVHITAEPRSTAADHISPFFAETERDQGNVGTFGRNRANLIKINALRDVDQDNIYLPGLKALSQANQIADGRL